MKRTLFILLFLSFIGVSPVLATPSVIDFEIEIELKNDVKYDIEYELRGPNKIEAKYAVPGAVTAHGKNAVQMIEPLMDELKVAPNMNLEKLKTNVLHIFQIEQSQLDNLEIEIKFSSGEKIKIDD